MDQSTGDASAGSHESSTESHQVSVRRESTGGPRRRSTATLATDVSPAAKKGTKKKKKTKKHMGRFSDHLEPPALWELKTIYEGPGGKVVGRLMHSTTIMVTNRTVESEREGANCMLTTFTLGCWYFFFQTASIEIYEVSWEPIFGVSAPDLWPSLAAPAHQFSLLEGQRDHWRDRKQAVLHKLRWKGCVQARRRRGRRQDDERTGTSTSTAARYRCV